MSVLSPVFSILLFFCSTFYVTPFILRLIVRLVGRRLRQTTEARRNIIYDRVRAEQASFLNSQDEGTKSASAISEEEDEEGWEAIETQGVRTARNGDVPDKEWDGVFGFFHPFW